VSTTDAVKSQLRRELAFLERGGYRVETSWRSSLFFEDSPICTNPGRSTECAKSGCVLMAFVPDGFRYEAVPCRHIPLNESGEPLQSLYRTGTNEEIEDAVRQWLISTIGELERGTSPEKTKVA
jgi:hypothetical protein